MSINLLQFQDSPFMRSTETVSCELLAKQLYVIRVFHRKPSSLERDHLVFANQCYGIHSLLPYRFANGIYSKSTCKFCDSQYQAQFTSRVACLLRLIVFIALQSLVPYQFVAFIMKLEGMVCPLATQFRVFEGRAIDGIPQPPPHSDKESPFPLLQIYHLCVSVTSIIRFLLNLKQLGKFNVDHILMYFLFYHILFYFYLQTLQDFKNLQDYWKLVKSPLTHLKMQKMLKVSCLSAL